MALEAARKDGQTVTPQGEVVGQNRIDGVRIAPLNPILTRGGATVESYRADGPFAGFDVKQVNYCPLRPGFASDWHMHRIQNDVIIPLSGEVHVGLFDDREGSPTYGKSLLLRISPLRMAAVLVPCGVWHALKNPDNAPAAYIVLNDQLYRHADPDDWRLKQDEPALHGIL